MQGFFLADPSVVATKEIVVIRAEEEGEGQDGLRLLDGDGEGTLEGAVTHVATAFLRCLDAELIVLEARRRGDECRAEVLILEGYPAEGLLDIFAGFAGRL